MRIQLLFPLLITSLLLSACDGNPSTWINQYWPRVNPDQKYIMTIDGYLDPSLADLIDLQFSVTYQTTKPSCEEYASLLEGVAFNRQKTLDYPVKTAGKFQLRLPLDQYLPGACGWEIESISFFTKPLQDIVTGFYKENIDSKPEASTKITCSFAGKSNLSCEQKSRRDFTKEATFNMKNLIYKIDIETE